MFSFIVALALAEEGKFLLAKILAPNKSALCRIDSLVFSFVIFLYIYNGFTFYSFSIHDIFRAVVS